nr:hypothetical protein BaRGS_033741 [Batillaria attramentaria]
MCPFCLLTRLEDFPPLYKSFFHMQSRILVYTAEGKISYQQQLPRGILNTNNDHDGQTSASVPSRQEGSASSTGGPRLKISAMAVGADGSLCLGDTAGGRVVMLDAEGNMTGEYRGPDGHSGCVPRSVCLASHGQVVVADSAQSSVELVSAEGHLLATLLVREHFQDSGVPTAVATDSKGRLWVGTSLGHVSAYSFLQRNP